MGTIKLPQNSFTSGVIDFNKLRGRIDLKQYYNSAADLNNVLINPQGGVYRRQGTKFIYSYTGKTVARMEVFEYNDDIKYLLLFWAGNIDVWENDVLVYTITGTGLTNTQIREFDIAQFANSMILAHGSMPPKELFRGANSTSWTFGSLVFAKAPVFGFSISSSNPAFTLTPSAISSTVKLTASGASFAASNVGGYISGNGGEARITKYVSTTVVEAFVTVPFIDTTAIPSGQWELETGYEVAWSALRGYPRCVAFHEDRLLFGGTPSLPDVIWASAIGESLNFDDTRAFKNSALVFSLRSDKMAEVRGLMSADNLLIFTSSSEYYVDGLLTAELDFKVKRQDRRGIRKNVKPVFVDGVAVFADSKAAILREFSYNDLDQKYNTPNLNLLASHIINNPTGIQHHEPRGERASDNIYVVNGDGTWAVLNTLRKQEITGWTTGSSRQDKLISVKNFDGVLYAMFERQIDGETEFYLEKFLEEYTMDCVITYSGAATDTITGLDELEGADVGVLVNGRVHVDRTVVDGEITLDGEYTEVQVGLKFSPFIRLLPPNRELPDGTMIGRIKKVASLNIGCSNTFGIQVNDTIPVKFYTFGIDMFSQPPPLFNGRKRVTNRGFNREPMPTLSQIEQLSFHITDVTMEVVV